MSEEVLRNVRCDERPGNSEVGPGLWRDDCGHPNELGYRFIQRVLSDFYRDSRIRGGDRASTASRAARSSPAEFVSEHVAAAQSRNFLARLHGGVLSRDMEASLNLGAPPEKHLDRSDEEEDQEAEAVDLAQQEKDGRGLADILNIFAVAMMGCFTSSGFTLLWLRFRCGSSHERKSLPLGI
eukprot:gnl/TRDRNA2_/TRDRNA2_167164_c4_seq4.p1 gnl/TRDRNA2_/TRDRNA2_167164_c4~~gnl/TRDRNA2_/TRDRNA2_167164_c4_seq4.p1  ORF type:complete len:182 (+),score=27.19 gnl/TRDRNA2_/TRDRNA2_167164_c4_seq4:532-1077(+)